MADFLAWFPGVTREQVEAVLRWKRHSRLSTPATRPRPKFCVATTSRVRRSRTSRPRSASPSRASFRSAARVKSACARTSPFSPTGTPTSVADRLQWPVSPFRKGFTAGTKSATWKSAGPAKSHEIADTDTDTKRVGIGSRREGADSPWYARGTGQSAVYQSKLTHREFSGHGHRMPYVLVYEASAGE